MLSQLTAAIVEGAADMGVVIEGPNFNLVAVDDNPRDRAIICPIKGEGLGAAGLGNYVSDHPAMNYRHYFLVWVRCMNALESGHYARIQCLPALGTWN